MASEPPRIPNLLSLRGTRGASRGIRSRGRGGRPGHPPGPGPTQDQTIQGTDEDAAISRLSAVSLGYLHDAFAQYFVEATTSPPTRRLPIINRGTYTRTCAIDRLVDSFLGSQDSSTGVSMASQTPQRQVISLGSGTDTRIFRLLSSKPRHGLIYHELDFPVTVQKKARIVRAVPSLREVLGNPIVSEDGSWSCQSPLGAQYFCHAVDLRDMAQQDPAFPPLKGLQASVPTLLISECCLCYLETPAASCILEWFANQIPALATVLYEPIRPHDAFGKMMASNLAQRGIRMPTIESYPSPSQQEDRLRDAGLQQARALTVKEIWDTWVPPEEKKRVDHLEGLDEVEEWQLLADHYVVAWGWRGETLGL